MIYPIRYNKTIFHLVTIAVLRVIMIGHAAQSGHPMRFQDVTAETGITFEHTNGSSGEFYLMEAVSAGLALFDYDND
jgi:hypothetical protein